MSHSRSPMESSITRLREYCQRERYSPFTEAAYVTAVGRFIGDLERRGLSLESVSEVAVESYLGSLRQTRTDNPVSPHERWTHGAAIRMMLRLVHGAWPAGIKPATTTALEADKLVTSYDAWMELRGLSLQTRESWRADAHRLLHWFGCKGKTIASISVADLDAYIASRSASMRRGTIAHLASTVRGFVRHLHSIGRMPSDLSMHISGPRIYALEGIPSLIKSDDVRRALDSARKDRSPLGRRDYAILMLLSTYGLRAGEITGLQLSDIDWRQERLRIRHTKTRATSDLPLLRDTANAFLDYLQHARPSTTERKVFLRMRAPYRPISSRCALRRLITRRLKAVGVVLSGKRGPMFSGISGP